MTEKTPRPTDRLMKFLVRLFPFDFRADHGPEIEQTFRAQQRDAAQEGRAGLFRLWAEFVAGIFRTAPREHLSILRQDATYAVRRMRQSPGFTAVIVLTLALGIGANSAIFSVVSAVLIRPLPFPDPAKIVLLNENDDDGTVRNSGYATYADWRDGNRAFKELAMIAYWGATLTGAGEPVRLDAVRVTANFFRTLGVAPALGRDFTAEDDRPGSHQKVMISHGLWQRRFGRDPGVTGRMVTINGAPHEIVGVLPAGYRPITEEHLYHRPEIWRVLGYDVSQPWACRSCRHLKIVGRLAEGVSREEAEARSTAILEKMRGRHPTSYLSLGARVTSLEDAVTSGVRPALLVLLGAVGLLLLIACVNVANLQLARAASRQREMAIRCALGASRARRVRQLLTENLVLGLAGGALGLLLAVWGVDALAALAPADLPRLGEIAVDRAVLGFTLLLAVLAGVSFGMAPVIATERQAAVEGLREGSRSSHGIRPRRTQGALVIANVALALVLLAGAGLLLRSFAGLLAVRPGFEPRGLLALHVAALGPKYEEDAQVRAFFAELERRLIALPGVQSVGISTQLPLGGNFDGWSVVDRENPPVNPAEAPGAQRFAVNPDYLSTMNIPLLAGRGITALDTAEAMPVVLVSQTMARTLWPGQSPLGKQITIGGGPNNPWRTVIGVVGDVRHQRLDETPAMQVYTPFAQQTSPYVEMSVRVAGEPAAPIPAMREAVWAIDGSLPISKALPYTEMIATTLAERRFTLFLIALFAGLAATLAAVGIYGVVSYAVAQRTHEIGIRMALGAQPGDIFRLVVRQGMALAVLGVTLGLTAAWALTRFLQGLLFGVKPTDFPTFAGVAVLLAGVALVACAVPARRATRVDPIIALRYE